MGSKFPHGQERALVQGRPELGQPLFMLLCCFFTRNEMKLAECHPIGWPKELFLSPPPNAMPGHILILSALP